MRSQKVAAFRRGLDVGKARELSAVARDVGAADADIHLGRDASETTLKRAPLAQYSIVYFATHGLVAGDVRGIGEPSLALSIPDQPSELDDGLLTASEVAQLKLNADWVVLSACNTIAGDKPGAEALSGLARSFFYAGARALLVSHWAVDSETATRLSTATFDLLKNEPSIGRAEALRRVMLTYLDDPLHRAMLIRRSGRPSRSLAKARCDRTAQLCVAIILIQRFGCATIDVF
jgi:CHAT domain-containing protein